ncbi:DUF7003 family protein [Bacillus cereus]|uniref:DUF7003 family protein n=1 Tax=Bacillus cereus TaxID=1396 RepID=UPI00256FC03C|nr:hypothetical protein [Bacillus cereus]WJE23257.1 hypothetical protein QRE65_02540 [Bacillus cereus]
MKTNILKMLDDKKEHDEFPLLDNYNFDLSQTKLSVFLRNNSDWLIVFQMIGTDKLGVSNWIYMYGNTINRCYKEVVDDIILQIKDTKEYDLFDEEGNFIPNLYEGEIVIHDNPFKYKFTKEQYLNNGIEIKNINSYSTYFLRMLFSCKESRNLLWSKDNEILKELEDGTDWMLWYETCEWQHTVEEKVSENLFFQTLVRAIEEKDLRIINKGETNTSWENWIDSDFENQ